MFCCKSVIHEKKLGLKVKPEVKPERLRYGYIETKGNIHQQLCILSGKRFSNEAIKPPMLQNHLQSVHPAHKGEDQEFFTKLRDERGSIVKLQV